MHFALDISVLRIAQAGVLVYTRNLIDHLVTAGQEHRWTLLDVLPLNPGKPMACDLRAFDAPNVRVARLPGLQRGYASMLPGARTGPFHRAAERIDHLLDRPWSAAATLAVGLQLRLALRGIELFHSSDQFVYAAPRAAALLTIHDLTTLAHPEWHAQENTAMHSGKDRFAARADRLIAVSQATKQDIITYLDVPPDRISVVYEAADERFRPYSPDQARPTLDRYGLQWAGYILSLGTVEPRKNYLRLIEAYALLRERFANRDEQVPPLIIAGGYGWLYEEILAAPGRFGLGQHVRLLGKIPDEDLPHLLAGAALFVYPSLYEGFGLPVLEAMASGVPVVASNTSSLPEVLGDTGLYCNPLDIGSIAQALDEALSQPELAARMRAAGRARAAHFSWERVARETLDVYAQAVAERRQ